MAVKDIIMYAGQIQQLSTHMSWLLNRHKQSSIFCGSTPLKSVFVSGKSPLNT